MQFFYDSYQCYKNLIFISITQSKNLSRETRVYTTVINISHLTQFRSPCMIQIQNYQCYKSNRKDTKVPIFFFYFIFLYILHSSILFCTHRIGRHNGTVSRIQPLTLSPIQGTQNSSN